MTAIEVINLNKFYKIYKKPIDRLKEIIARRPFHTKFKALHNVSFTVNSGMTLGVIGENGAGKSTLLKILAKTLKPTSGQVILKGRVSSLLELGAGFNPDLSGEENIYLNGYLMGLTREEINKKKKDIIEFAEIDDFIFQPIKTYSSGMQVRLAFSIATSVDPDILIVDEALSVGDEYFQRKSMNRMVDFKKMGKTILFCSHSIYYVQEICNEVIWLNKGEIRSKGSPSRVIMDYQNFERNKVSKNIQEPNIAQAKQIWIDDLKLLDKTDRVSSEFDSFDPLKIYIKLRNKGQIINGHMSFSITRNDGVDFFGTTTHLDGCKVITISDNKEVMIIIPSLPLLSGFYRLTIIIGDENALFPFDKREISFNLISSRREFGIAYLDHEWLY